jgi:soluble lytic murein transglycosylase
VDVKLFLYVQLVLVISNQALGVSLPSNAILKDIPQEYIQDEKLKSEQQQKNDDLEKDLTNFSHGVMSFERREFEEAKTYLVASLAQVDLAPYTYFYLGKVAVELKNFNAAYAAFEEALKFKPQFDLQRNIKLEMAKIMLLKNKLPQARQLFLSSRMKFKRTEIYPEILWNLFLIDFKQNAQSQCYWFKALFENYPNYEVAKTWTLESATWVYDNKEINCSLNFVTKYRHISQLIALGDYEAVKVNLEIAKSSLPKIDYFDLMSNYELRAGNPVAAFDELTSSYDELADNRKFIELYIKVSSRALKHEQALESFDKIINLERNARVKAGLIFRKGFLLYELGQYENSYNAMNLVNLTFANHPYQGDVTWYLGWTAYLQKKYDVALTHFEKIHDLVRRNKYVRSRDRYSLERIKYWMAHSYKGLGNNELAAQFMQEVIDGERLSYYSFLASAYLPELLPENKKMKANERLLTALNVPWLNAAVRSNANSDIATRNYVLKDNFNPSTDVYLSQDRQNELEEIFDHEKFKLNLKRFKLLVQTGFHEDARWELQELEKKTKDKTQKRQLVQLYRQLDDIHRASKIMTLSFQNERQNSIENVDPFEVWAQTFPRPHQQSVSGSAQAFQVPENLVYSIMRAESFYSKTAMSGVGARGLLQLMPHTASQVSSLLGQTNGILPERLFEPDTNIQLGVRYLNRLLKTFSGDKTLAIAAYNAGPHRAEWWVNQFGSLRQDEFIEHILFLETRNYVKKVLQFNWIYDLLYDNQVSFVDIKSPLEFQLTGTPSLTETWD